ncbi:MAG: hypothetical protein LBI18_10280 [Planctomycetaceae bacterium]|nr:hypothetical protein [Planctomycetaceae bacterium]
MANSSEQQKGTSKGVLLTSTDNCFREQTAHTVNLTIASIGTEKIIK